MITSTLSPLPVSTFARCSVAEVNLHRLRDLAGQLHNAVRELQEIGRLGKERVLLSILRIKPLKGYPFPDHIGELGVNQVRPHLAARS